MSVYLFRPPTRTVITPMEGALTYGFDVSQTVWKSGGVWHSQECPSFETLAAADVVLAGRPQIITSSVATELIAAGIGECLPIES